MMTNSSPDEPIPILSGDFPDPTIVRVGADYYLTNSTNVYAPSLLIWHSTDLFNWLPEVSAIDTHDGDLWAPDISYCSGRFYIYYTTSGRNKVICADKIEGPWSEPIDLNIGHIDPGHAAGAPKHAQGEECRYLFLIGGQLVRLAVDGLSTVGDVRKVYDRWPIPFHWRIGLRIGLLSSGAGTAIFHDFQYRPLPLDS